MFVQQSLICLPQLGIVSVLIVLFQFESKNTTFLRLFGHKHAAEGGGGGVEVDVNKTNMFLRFENNSSFFDFSWMEALFSMYRYLRDAV